MESYSYESQSIVDYIPGELDLSAQLRLSSDVLRREQVDIAPAAPSIHGISQITTSNVVDITIADPARWIDPSTTYLKFDVGNIRVPAPPTGTTANANFCVLDGPFANINKINVALGGGVAPVFNMNDVNKVMNARYTNQAMEKAYVTDGQLLNPGCSKYVPIIGNTFEVPTSKDYYSNLASMPGNFTMVSGSSAIGGAVTPNDTLLDGLGFMTGEPQANLNQYYGYKNSYEPGQSTHTVSIKLGDLVPFFSTNKYLPLFLFNSIKISIWFAPPSTAFCSDYSTINTASSDVTPGTIYSYDVDNIRIVTDLITCSDVLNNAFRMRANSEDGIVIPF